MTAELTNQGVAPRADQGAAEGRIDARIEWYARSEVDLFLEAAGRQRTELEEQIARAEARAERARTAAGLHRVMATMVLDTQRDLAEVRRQAEEQARAIVQAGVTRPDAASAPNGVRADAARLDAPRLDDTTTTIDLVAAGQHSNGSGSALAPPGSLSNGKESDTQEGDAEFLAFLRDGLGDPGPLGPPSV